MSRRRPGFWKFLFRADERSSKRLEHVYARGFATLAIVVGLNSSCQKHDAYEKYEWPDLDRLQNTSSSSVPVRGISVVSISSDDYQNPKTFDSTSPLKRSAVFDVIDGICSANPFVLGVDLVTAEWTPPDRSRALDLKCPIIWIFDADPSDRPSVRSELAPVRRGKVLGGTELTDSRSCAALPVLPPSGDGVVREYSVYYGVDAPVPSGASAAQPEEFAITLVGALARSRPSALGCLGDRRPAESDLEKKKIRFTGNSRIQRLNAGLVSRLGRAAVDSHPEKGGTELTTLVKGKIEDRIVILGGEYRQAKDKHMTPIGYLSGAEILANAVYTEQDPDRAIRKVEWWVSGSIDFAVGAALLLVVVPLRLRWPWSFALLAIGTVIAAVAVSWLLFNYRGYFLGVFGALVGVLLAIVVESLYEEWREFYGRLLDYRTERIGNHP